MIFSQQFQRGVFLLRLIDADRDHLEIALAVHAIHRHEIGKLRHARPAPARPDIDDKLLVVNVWASWCGPCVAELPDFVTMNRMYRKRNFQMITISVDEPEQKDAALKLLRENHASTANLI